MTYQSTSASLLMYDLMKEKTIDKEAQNILTSYISEAQNVKNEIVKVFNSEKAVIPIGFDERDVMRETSPLFDGIFHIMYLRQVIKLNFQNSAIFSAISYMKEVQDIFKLNYDIANKYYVMTTSYLLAKGVLARPPYVTMPKQVEFIEDKNYMSGFNVLSDKRSLNTIEVGYINEAIEANVFGMQLMTGFAQVAKENEVKKYFIQGKELSKKIVTELSNIMMQSDIQPPSTWAGKATDLTNPPFTDKLMMYITSLISSSAMAFNVLGTTYSMRSDLQLKLGLISKDIFQFAKEGAEIMIKHRWMEEPPQMEDRNQLTR
jgi:hypothetical protein